MHIVTIWFIAFGLAMDALAVSIATGMTIGRPDRSQALRVAAFFGSFQVGMPIIGWSAGFALSYIITGIDHWIAFCLLAFIGCKMIYESTRREGKRPDPPSITSLLGLSVATSIDALGAGVTFVFADIPLIMALVTIGTVTFVLSFIGVYLGHRIGRVFESIVETAGGVVLIAIGVKILLDHLR